MNPKNPQIVYLPHGGGPLPILGGYDHENLSLFLRELPSKLRRPNKILVISAHWEEELPSITSNVSPEMIYDYFGFPDEAYKFEYSAPGEPGFAATLHQVLKGSKIEANLDPARGYDHGLYIPLMLMYPEADIPCVQLSLLKNLDPEKHFTIGQALGKLLQADVLVIGSGMSFHNMREFGSGKSQTEAKEFSDWLVETCTDNSIPPDTVKQRLINWKEAPSARFCHPREEHLLPLHVCYGIAYKRKLQAELVFDKTVLGQRCQSFKWS